MQTKPNAGKRLIQFVVKMLLIIATTALAAMMFLMAADVVGRYFFNHPIPGGMELVEYLMATFVPLAVAYCSLERSHIAVDLIADKLPRRIRGILRIIIGVISFVFIGLIGWQNFAYIGEMYNSNLTSAVLKIPAFPFVAFVAVGMSIFAVVTLMNLFEKQKKEN
jgi:TRAP-type C4-dicarboxylate transport system permease small subunit